MRVQLSEVGTQMRASSPTAHPGRPVRFAASDVYDYFRPAPCELRVWLRRHGVEEAPPGPYELVLRRLGERHERRHLAAFPDVVDLSGVPAPEREVHTLEAIRASAPVIYQAAFGADHVLAGVPCRIVGHPDFLIRDGDSYRIRDSKLARRVGPRAPSRAGRPPPKPHHAEIVHQLQIYGWLYEQTVGTRPAGLEVHAGTGDIVQIVYDGGAAALELLALMVGLELRESEPYSPVGWTKCGRCGFHARCWPPAVARMDVAVVPGCGQDLALALHESGVGTVHDLLTHFDEQSLAAFTWLRRARGTRPKPLGAERAAVLLRNARVLASGQELMLKAPALPESRSYVIFDIEGLPPQLDELEKVYLWGLQAFGDPPGEFLPATAGFGPEGDRAGWEDFLRNARSLLDAYGDLPFVHWHHYERVKLDLYIDRFGDPDGIAARVVGNLLDLCKVLNEAIVLPLPSSSLKVVERYVGFARSLPGYGADRAMASYIEAVETEDDSRRTALMEEILAYNREDLEATWAVLAWLETLAATFRTAEAARGDLTTGQTLALGPSRPRC